MKYFNAHPNLVSPKMAAHFQGATEEETKQRLDIFIACVDGDKEAYEHVKDVINSVNPNLHDLTQKAKLCLVAGVAMNAVKKTQFGLSNEYGVAIFKLLWAIPGFKPVLEAHMKLKGVETNGTWGDGFMLNAEIERELLTQ